MEGTVLPFSLGPFTPEDTNDPAKLLFYRQLGNFRNESRIQRGRFYFFVAVSDGLSVSSPANGFSPSSSLTSASIAEVAEDQLAF